MARNRKLSDEDAADIRRLYHDRESRETVTTLARLFRVSTQTIQNVLEKRGAYGRKAV